jgi:2-dehydropantoate 2-reductase
MLIQNTIYIIGAGAIGKALAVFLKLEGKNVILIRGRIDDKSNYFEKIKVELTNNNTEVEAKVRISTISNFTTLNGIVVLTNKSHGNRHLAQALKNKINNSQIVILQNGLDVEQPFIDHSFTEIYRCVLFVTSQSLSQNLIRFKPVATSPIGIIKGDLIKLDAIVQQLNNTYFEFIAEQNIEPVIWTKAIVNSVFNSVCPLLEIDNGIFHRDAAALNIAKRIIVECITVAECKGIYLNADKVINSLLMISKSSDGQLISTYQDIKNKRRTEIETLNFAITNIAKEFKKGDTVKETRLLGELIYIKSELALHGK